MNDSLFVLVDSDSKRSDSFLTANKDSLDILLDSVEQVHFKLSKIKVLDLSPLHQGDTIRILENRQKLETTIYGKRALFKRI